MRDSRLRPWAVIVWVWFAATAAAQEARDLTVGRWVQLKGALESPGVFAAGEVEVLRPGSSEALTATIGDAGAGGGDAGADGFTLLGLRVDVDARTLFEGVDRNSPEGARVKVSGKRRSDGGFFARRVARRDQGRDRIEGRIDAIEERDGVLHLSVLSFDVRVDPASKLELEAPLSEVGFAPARELTMQAPQRDEDDRVRGTVRLGEDWVLGGLLEWDGENRGNYDLDDTRDRDRLENALSARLELVWTPSERALFLASYEHLEEWREEQSNPDSHQEIGHVKEAYGFFRGALLGWDVQFGRAAYHEPRRWLYNTELDGLRVLRRFSDLEFELSATTKVADGSDRDESTTNLTAIATYGTSKRSVGLWAMQRDDRDSSGELQRHLGARALGKWLPATDVWGELCVLEGESGGKDVSGFAFDFGATFAPDFLGPFSLIAGYAFGTGDSSPTNADSSTFRQTGFHDNKSKLESATSIRYYGELLDPELANLGVATVGVGLRLEKRTTLTLVAHQYTLDHAEDALYGANLRAATDGVHPEIGREYDLVLGTKRWSSWQLELIAGLFDPGAAFPGADRAWLGAVQLKYRF